MFAVEARIFDNGNIYAFVRPSYDGETDSYIEDVYCDIYITIFLMIELMRITIVMTIRMLDYLWRCKYEIG